MAGLDDLINFLAIDQAKQKAIAEADPYAGSAGIADQIGQAIQTSGPQYSTKDKLISGLITGLIGGGLKGASTDYQQRAQEAYQNTIDDTILGKDVERPTVLTSGLFGSAKNQAGLFKKQLALSQAQMGQDITKAGLLAKAGELGKLSAYDELGAGSGGSILDPRNKAKRDEEGAARTAIKSTPMVNNYADVKSNFDTLKDLYKLNDRPSTLAFISSFARVLDPGSTVKEGEIKNAENTQTFLSALGYNIDSLMNGTQSINSTTKQEMVRAAAQKYNNFGNDYSNYVQGQKDIVGRYGGDPNNVVGPLTHTPFDFASWAKGATQQTLAEELGASGASDPATELAAIRNKLAAGGLSAEAKSALVERARSIVNPQAPTVQYRGNAPLG